MMEQLPPSDIDGGSMGELDLSNVSEVESDSSNDESIETLFMMQMSAWAVSAAQKHFIYIWLMGQ